MKRNLNVLFLIIGIFLLFTSCEHNNQPNKIINPLLVSWKRSFYSYGTYSVEYINFTENELYIKTAALRGSQLSDLYFIYFNYTFDNSQIKATVKSELSNDKIVYDKAGITIDIPYIIKNNELTIMLNDSVLRFKKDED